MDRSAVGRLDQDFVANVSELSDVAGGQRRPPLPGVDVFAADGHDGLVVLMAALACEAARPLTLMTEESEHDFSAHLLGTRDTEPQAAEHTAVIKDTTERVPDDPENISKYSTIDPLIKQHRTHD